MAAQGHEHTEMVVRRGDSRGRGLSTGEGSGKPAEDTVTSALSDTHGESETQTRVDSNRAHSPGLSPPGRPHPPSPVLLCPGYEWTFRANAWAAGGRRPHSRLSSRRLTTWRARPRRNWWKPRVDGLAPRLAPCALAATGLRDAGVLTQRAGGGHAGTGVDGAQRGPLSARGVPDLLGVRPPRSGSFLAFSRFQLSRAAVGGRTGHRALSRPLA